MEMQAEEEGKLNICAPQGNAPGVARKSGAPFRPFFTNQTRLIIRRRGLERLD